jgi:hypothetical protein
VDLRLLSGSAPMSCFILVAAAGTVAVASGPFFGPASVDFMNPSGMSQWGQSSPRLRRFPLSVDNEIKEGCAR